MAAGPLPPEELDLDFLLLPDPSSPSVFIDLPPTPPPPNYLDDDDMVLPYISYMLMEEDCEIVKLFAAIGDNPKGYLELALAPQRDSFFQESRRLRIGSTSSSSSRESTSTQIGEDKFIYIKPLVVACSLGLPGNEDVLNLALLKGMEEGSRFLPTNNGLLNSMTQVNTGGKLKNMRSTLQQDEDEPDEAETSRNSKLMVPAPEETGEMVDQIALNMFSWCLGEIQSLRWTIDGEQVRQLKTKKKKNGKYWAYEAGTDLHTLLIHCAQAVGMNDRWSATQLVGKIRKHSSPRGDANQRLAHCFAQGLEARLAGTAANCTVSFNVVACEGLDRVARPETYKQWHVRD
ncbi:scarecrow-like protein 33 [Miscanthus floridulus]|uniref:scarecrow-like protein 33 n=1 Tax=Miscanthus floridulus TaxID=154761 RepID=UPI003459A98B